MQRPEVVRSLVHSRDRQVASAAAAQWEMDSEAPWAGAWPQGALAQAMSLEIWEWYEQGCW